MLVGSTSIYLDFPPAGQGCSGPAPAAGQGAGQQLGFPQVEVSSCLPAFKSFTKFCLCCCLWEGFVLSLSPKPTIRRTNSHRQQFTRAEESPWLARHMLTRQQLLTNVRCPHAYSFMRSGTQLWAPCTALLLPRAPWLKLALQPRHGGVLLPGAVVPGERFQC